MPDSPLIVALDVDSIERAESLVKILVGKVQIYKIGLRLFTRYGPRAVEMVLKAGGRVFLDLKFHDIPNTVAGASESAVALGVSMMTLHVQGGDAMLRAAVEATREAAKRLKVTMPKLIGVTVLTSVAATSKTPEAVTTLAILAKKSGLDGIVCSPHETPSVRAACGPKFLIITPGIRLAGADRNDQGRVATPSEARRLGADYVVVGRPIVENTDPLKAALSILAEVS